MKVPGAAEFVPAGADLDGLRAAANGCRGCELYRHASRTVFGTGPSDAELVLIGEQPGDREDRTGEPFVGPAGAVLDRALVEAGIGRDTVYLTNAVKHFKFTERGRQRIHQRPGRTEIVACAPWLSAELDTVAPRLVVCLGAIAAQAFFGPDFRLTRERGRVIVQDERRALATIHPAAVLRVTDRDDTYAGLVADLTTAATAPR